MNEPLNQVIIDVPLNTFDSIASGHLTFNLDRFSTYFLTDILAINMTSLNNVDGAEELMGNESFMNAFHR